MVHALSIHYNVIVLSKIYNYEWDDETFCYVERVRNCSEYTKREEKKNQNSIIDIQLAVYINQNFLTNHYRQQCMYMTDIKGHRYITKLS